MKYRVRLDLSFTEEANAKLLMNYAKQLSSKAVSLNEGAINEEIGYVDYHLCGHDENKPCSKIERVEIRKLEVIR